MVPARLNGRAAALITELAAPALSVFLIAVICGTAGRPGWGGAGWGVVGGMFCGGLPYAALELSARSGRLTSRHVTERRQRPFAYAICIGSALIGGGLMVGFHAPALLLWGVGMMLAGLIIAAVITVAGVKVSMHAMCATALVTVATLLGGPWWLLLGSVVPVIIWARMRLEHHTWTESIAGVVLGVATPLCAWGLAPA